MSNNHCIDFSELCKTLGMGYTEYKNLDRCIKDDAKFMVSQMSTWCNPGSGMFYPFDQALANVRNSVPEKTMRLINIDIYTNRLIYELKKLGVEFRVDNNIIIFRI